MAVFFAVGNIGNKLNCFNFMKIRLACLFVFTPFMAMSQTAPAPSGVWSYSLGAQRYAEPAMQLVGPAGFILLISAGLGWTIQTKLMVCAQASKIITSRLTGAYKSASNGNMGVKR